VVIKLTAAARCLMAGCDWPPPEGAPDDAGKAADRHTDKAKHPTATVMRPA
jgi:hypothetical protein